MNDMRAIARFAAAALFASLAFAQEFEVVSIKPNTSGSESWGSHSGHGRLTAENISLRDVVLMAYGMKDYQVEAPGWLRDARFDIAAKAPDGLPSDSEKYTAALRVMMQNMLATRFKMTAHRDSRMSSAYGLVTSKNGIKFKQDPDCSSADSSSSSHNTHYTGGCITMATFAEFLSRRFPMPVIDKTGLPGNYNLKLDWDPQPKVDSPDLPSGTSLPLALQEQLGLKLESVKAPVEILIVDRIEKLPTGN